VIHGTKIVILGRPNVGKSTLFNRLLGRRRALVHNEPGVTRDRLEEKAEWWVKGKQWNVSLVDTGGLGGDKFAEEIEHQVGIALSEAGAALMVFDAQAGLTPADRDLVRKIKQSGVDTKIPVFAIANKVDDHSHESLIADFYEVGLERVLTVSAEHGRGMDDLREALAEQLGFDEEEVLPVDLLETSEEGAEMEEGVEAEAPREAIIPRIAIIGRPNVGKSTMTNALVGNDRMITSPIAGTTIDAVDSLVELGGKPFVLIDTAGIRRKSKTEQGVEVLSVVQARKALERAHVAILLLDGESGVTDQDEKIGSLIEEVGCSVILMVNKWDTQRDKKGFDKEDAAKIIRKEMAYLRYAPLAFVSARDGEGFEDLGELIEDVLHQRKLKIPTHELTEWVRKEAAIHNPMNAKFFMTHQSGRNPPTFVCHVNNPDKVHFSLRRHLMNALRERWGYVGTPVRLLFLEGKSRGYKAGRPSSR
jgi:GTPase